MPAPRHRNALESDYRLLWYRIERVLGVGGFGITYLATDLNLRRRVAIKEYLPIELAVREQDQSIHPVSEDRAEMYAWGLARFTEEARTLARFEHSNIVRVFNVFEAPMDLGAGHGDRALARELRGRAIASLGADGRRSALAFRSPPAHRRLSGGAR